MEDEEVNYKELYNVGDIIHYLRVLPNVGVNEILECKLRTVSGSYMVGARLDKTQQAVYIDQKSRRLVFTDRKLALKESKKIHVREVKREESEEE